MLLLNSVQSLGLGLFSVMSHAIVELGLAKIPLSFFSEVPRGLSFLSNVSLVYMSPLRGAQEIYRRVYSAAYFIALCDICHGQPGALGADFTERFMFL